MNIRFAAFMATIAVALAFAAACDRPSDATTMPAAFNLRDVQNSPQYAKGNELFLNVCTLCHMEQGEGQPGIIPSLHGAPIAVGDPDAFARILLHGLEGKVTIKGQTYEGAMPPATFTTDEEIAAVMTFVRNSWGNAAGPVTPEQVAKVREQTKDRVKPWTFEELHP